MKKFIIAATLLIASLSQAQNLSVFNLDASGFPQMKASFYAFDANGVQQSPSPNEITITEDGIQRTVTNITCPPKKDPPPITLGIMVDTYSGIDLAKEGAQKLINLISIPPSEAGITMMDHGAFIVQDLTQKIARLDTAIAKLQPAPGVDLQTMFYAPNAGCVPFVSAGKNSKKVLVLITDLHCPLLNLDKAKLFADCASQNITIDIVLINTNDAMGYAKDITEHTGGLLLENVETSSDIVIAMLKIYPYINNFSPCEITWQSDTTCSFDAKNVVFAWNAAKSTSSYAVPSNTVAQLQFSPALLYSLSKPIGQKFDTSVTVTAKNASFSVTNITSTNPIYDINPKSFFLPSGQSKTLTISYTAIDSSYTWTRFDIQNDHCIQTFYDDGGYPKHRPAVATIELTKPNGGEVFLTNIDTAITWTGIPLIDTVRLDYSLDSGNSWNIISDKATGGKSTWHLPGTTSKKCLVEVSQIMNGNDGWVRQSQSKFSGSGSEGTSITIDTSGNVYVAGRFTDTVNFGDKQLISRSGYQGIFLAKYQPSGIVDWIYKPTELPFARGQFPSITSDRSGNIYITGSFDTLANFGNDTLHSEGLEDIFLAKYRQDGTVDWAKRAGGIHTDFATGIALDTAGNIYISGIFYNSADFDTIKVKNASGSYYADLFVAKYNSNGNIEWVTNPSMSNLDIYSSGPANVGIVVDDSGNVYVTGAFQGSANFGGTILNAHNASNTWDKDLFIVKYRPDRSVEWAKSAGGLSSDEGIGITLDGFGNLYVSGICSDTANFDGTTLKSQGDFLAKYHTDGSLEWIKPHTKVINGWGRSNIVNDSYGNLYVTSLSAPDCVSKYRPDGSIEWIKSPATSRLNSLGIICDPSNNIYVTGTFVEAANFDGTKLFSNNGDMFIWKIADNILQSDTSESLFSIIAPTFSFSPNTIDMGQEETGKEKDSVVKATICNSGNMPLHVLGMDVTGGATTEFMIMSGAGDFTLLPGECRDVMFTFMPMMTGKMSATVTLRTANGNYPDTIKILGEGIAPLLSVISNVIDFGQITIGSFKDTTIAVAIQNIGSLPVNFSATSQLGPDMKQFSLQAGNAPFTLLPSSSQSVTLRFAPHYIGRTSGRIAFAYSGPSSPAILNVFGQGLGGAVRIPDNSGYAGDHKNIPMLLEKVPLSSVQSEATNFSARIAYDRTVLYPSQGKIQHGNRYDTVTITSTIGTSDTITLVPFVPLLGESTTSPMNIVDFAWLDGTGQPADYDVETMSGTFHMLGICPAGGNRLFNPDGVVSMSVSPNPANGTIHIVLQTTELGLTQLGIMNLLGQKVASISDGELKPGVHSFDFNSGQLSAGSYFILLQTPTVRRLVRIDVEK